MSRVEITPDAIAAVLSEYPQLTWHGFREDPSPTPWSGDAAHAQVQRVVDHLVATYPRGTRINPNAYSYSLKHVYERLAGEYITNGTFILAALLAGYRCEPQDRGPNATFDMRQREVLRAWSASHNQPLRRSCTPEERAGDTQREFAVDWDALVDTGRYRVPARDALEAIILDCVIDTRGAYDPLDEDDPAAVFAEIVVDDLRSDGAESRIGQQFGDLLAAAPIGVDSAEPGQDCPRGYFRVTIAGEAFEGPLVDIPCSYVFS